MYKRFGWNPNIRADWQETGKLPHKPSRIFVSSTMELFGDWIKTEWMSEIFNMVKRYPQHTFIFLTKRPENLIKFSPFPDNCYVGVSVTNQAMFDDSIKHIDNIEARVKFISFEPLLEHINVKAIAAATHYRWLDWLIIGQQTPVRMSTMPQIGWVEDIVHAADKAGIPVFLKDNLISCVDQYVFAMKDGKYRQELPLSFKPVEAGK
jgi:protein gp37